MKKNIVKKYPRNTYDFGDLKISISSEGNRYTEFTKPEDRKEPMLIVTLYNESNQNKQISFKINSYEFENMADRDHTLTYDYDYNSLKKYIELFSTYKYLKENDIKHEILDELKIVLLPNKNLDNEYDNLNKESLEDVYNKCSELDLFNKKEVKNNLEKAKQSFEQHNKALDNKAKRMKIVKDIGLFAPRVFATILNTLDICN